MRHPDVITGFRKSSHSDQLGDCLEIARTGSGGHAVRDSKNSAGPSLTVGGAAWSCFVDEIKGAYAR
ncbi:DUF397 domain-containing protein [Streptomyces venezuelae]|uniref:DUF397 domain-containing protein n=1 Tax=Streptomyces venezuelae TaxID=54571 RepID=A0A5P2CI01_STRVZ|nr:DUF397 domain-containing protein [Streptomyces venezuelae]QES42093.1 DUF397 domain-containing protein [Streptomyces venezuelae]